MMQAAPSDMPDGDTANDVDEEEVWVTLTFAWYVEIVTSSAGSVPTWEV